MPVILAAKNDLIAYHNRNTSQTLVYKRDNTGQYNLLANHTVANPINLLVYTATDGEWIAWTSLETLAGGAQKLWCELFKVHNNGTISDFSMLDNSAVLFNYGDFLSDGSFVGVTATALYTFRYTNANWTLVNTFTFSTPMAALGGTTIVVPYFQFIGSHLVTVTEAFNEIHFYEHQANNSWVLSDKIVVTLPRVTGLAWNGGDTLMVTNYRYVMPAGTVGIIYIYTRVGARWTLEYYLTGAELDAINWLGSGVLAVNPETFFVSATLNGGYLVQRRNDGRWYLNGEVRSGNPGGFFPIGMAVNSYDVFIAQTNAINTMPLCAVEPIEFTCASTALESCEFDTFDASMTCELSSQCGDVTTSVKNFGISNNEHHVQFELNRFGAFATPVNVSFTCPMPTTNNPAGGPGNNPSAGPSGNMVPVTNAPNTSSGPGTSNVTSAARAIIGGSWFVGILLVVA